MFEAARADRLRRRAKEELAGVGDGGQDDERGEPVEQHLDRVVHVAAAPDHTETDSSMMLAAANPATSTRRRKS
jgi:hypothetical protein